jgi:hypothetical protein
VAPVVFVSNFWTFVLFCFVLFGFALCDIRVPPVRLSCGIIPPRRLYDCASRGTAESRSSLCFHKAKNQSKQPDEPNSLSLFSVKGGMLSVRVMRGEQTQAQQQRWGRNMQNKGGNRSQQRST